MANYQAKDAQTAQRQFKVETVEIAFVLASGAASVTCDEPSMLFLKTGAGGLDQITAALLATETAPTYVAPNDAAGQFSVLLRINETVTKVLSCVLTRGFTAGEVLSATRTATPSSGIVQLVTPTPGVTPANSNSTAICLNVDSAVDLTANAYDGVLRVSYITPRGNF